MKRVCIFLNGHFEKTDYKIKIMEKTFSPFKGIIQQNADFYAADGGLNYLLRHSKKPKKFCWVGDSDSLNKKSISYLASRQNQAHIKIVNLHTCKNLSDLAALLDLILAEKIKESLFIEIYGGLGKRRDHELANIQEVAQFLSKLPEGGAAFFHGGVVLTTLPLKFLQTPCLFFSIFAKNSFEIRGALYSGRFLLERPSHGLSNQKNQKVLHINPMNKVVTIYFDE